ncbi:hypothetical protein ACWC5C_16385 [Streptomyces sp. NPDC001700]
MLTLGLDGFAEFLLSAPFEGLEFGSRSYDAETQRDDLRMSSQPVDHGERITPMPALTLPALRSAVADLAPNRLAELTAEMQQAFDRAAATDSAAPIRMFYRRWGTVVAIERVPERAARMHAAEQVLHTSRRADARQTVLHEIAAIVQAAQREVEALETDFGQPVPIGDPIDATLDTKALYTY